MTDMMITYIPVVIVSPSWSKDLSPRHGDVLSQREVVGFGKRSVEARSVSSAELRKCVGICQVIPSHSARQSVWTESGSQLYSGMFPSCHN